MPKQMYLTMCINRQLKAELRRIASEEGRNMTAFVTKELDELLVQARKSRAVLSSRRRVGRTYFMMRITEELKTKLESHAAHDYRTLTDFIETALCEITNPRQARRPDSPLAAAADRNPVILRPQSRPARIAISLAPPLKAELQRLANNDYRTLANFIELKLYQKVAARQECVSQLPRRQVRHDRLSVRISTESKARLQKLANLEYRTITDFVEIRLRQAIASRRQVRPRSAGPRAAVGPFR